MNKCSDCKHLLDAPDKSLICSKFLHPTRADPETGRPIYTLRIFNGAWHGNCEEERKDYYTFWGNKLKTNNCGVVGRFYEKRGLEHE